MGYRLRAGISSRYVTSQLGQLSLASLRGRWIDWGKGGNVTSAGWQVTLCDPMWHVSSRSGVATLRTAIHVLLTYFTYFLTDCWHSWRSMWSMSAKRSSVRPSVFVCPIIRPQPRRAVGLLLSAVRAGDPGRQRHGAQQQMRAVSRLQLT